MCIYLWPPQTLEWQFKRGFHGHSNAFQRYKNFWFWWKVGSHGFIMWPAIYSACLHGRSLSTDLRWEEHNFPCSQRVGMGCPQHPWFQVTTEDSGTESLWIPGHTYTMGVSIHRIRITTTLKIINSIIKPTGKGCTEPQFLTLRPCPVLLRLHMASLPFPEPLWEVFKNPEIHQHDYLSWKLIEPFKTPKLKQTLI